jgi:hypothetical protein
MSLKRRFPFPTSDNDDDNHITATTMFSSLLRCHHPQRMAALAVLSACHVSHNTTDAEASRKQKEPKKEELFEVRRKFKKR